MTFADMIDFCKLIMIILCVPLIMLWDWTTTLFKRVREKLK